MKQSRRRKLEAAQGASLAYRLPVKTLAVASVAAMGLLLVLAILAVSNY